MWKELGLTPINSFDAFNLKPTVEYHFRVTPKNRYGWGPSVQTSSPLQVGGAECLPEFVKILPGQLKALLGTQLIFECTVRGAPRPQIDWYKDGMHISSLAERIRIRQIGSTCTLIIAPVSELDAGRYTCEATNSKGRVSTFARLQIVTDPRLYEADTKLKQIVHSADVAHAGDTLPIFTMRLRDRRVQMTYPVRLTCQVMGHPSPEIMWYKDDQQIVENRRCLITSDGQFHTLELASTVLDDSGIYTCTAKNELGSVSCHCSLVVDKGIRAYISPEFYMPLDPLYIYQEGQEIRLAAKVEAYPTVGVSWHRNGVRLRPSRRISGTLDSNGFVELIIADATIHDAGIYVCVASNAVGKVESSCRVVIEELDEDQQQQKQCSSSQIPAILKSDLPYSKEPMFVVKPRSSEAYEGDTVIIFCEVVGEPKPEVVWLRDFLNPEYYKDAPHFRPIGDGPEYRLEIPSAKLDFTGTYSVIASNCNGEAKAVISLQIFAKDILNNSQMEKGSIRHGNVETFPRFIRHLRDLRCCDGDAITLECHVEALPEPVIIWEKDGRVLPSGKDSIMSYDGIKATLSIPRIYPEDEGEYTCVAKNNLGRTLSSACIIVDVPEEKENMLNRQLSRPSGLLSASSTPRSTPRSTPNRCLSPRRLSYRSSQIDLSDGRIGSYRRAMLDTRTLAAPKFLAIPHSRVVEEGDNVRFQCAITGHPAPWSTWDKEGMIVTPTARIAVKEVDDLRFLEIDEVTFDDAGLYRITLENDYGRIEATARLDVISRSRYSRSPSVRSVRASSSKRNAHLRRRIMGPSTAIGGRMALATGYRGSSVPSCKFYHNGTELGEDDERVQIVVNEHEALLCIDNVTEDDEGLYTCIIQCDNEPLITSTWVKFEATESDALTARLREPSISRALPAKVEAHERETVDLRFELDCHEPYTYTWTRNGEVLVDDDDFNQIDHGNGVLCLRINDVFDLDSGKYTCEVRTASGLTCSTTCQLSVDEIADVVESAPILLKSPLAVLTNAGADEVVFCAHVHPPEASVQWFVAGREIVSDYVDEENANDSLVGEITKQFGASRVINESDGVRILRIQNVQPHHCGEVQLSVTHCGKSSSTLRAYTSLVVLPGPTSIQGDSTETTSATDKAIEALNGSELPEIPACILEGPQDYTAHVGGSVKLSVCYEAVPRAQVCWYKGCRPIVEQRNISIRSSAKRSTLLITEIAADDSGKYTVEIMNTLGSDAAAASVAVEGPPDAPSGKPSISQGPDRIAVAWCGPPYDGGCMITGFIIEMQQVSAEPNDETDDLAGGESGWHEIATVVDSLAYTVKNLTPSATYRFRVRAKNVHGCSTPSLPSDPVELQAQEIPTEDFHRPISVKSGGDFKSRFEILEELGKGRFGIVYRVQERENSKQILAAKVIKCIKAQDRQKVMEEISIMKSLQHPKLLQLAASFESAREIVMVMEYITGGELFERVVADDFTLTERDCILFLRQVCEGVAYMHTQSIVHLDLKPENIMCHTRTSHQIKIIDFGLAQRLNKNTPVRVLFGTPEFIPPEIISYEPIGFQSDMWSVGVICYVLLSGLSPFMGDTDVDTFSNITRADYDFDDEAFDCVSQEAKDFISNLLVHRKENRLTAKQCLESKWLTQEHDENLSNKICTDKLKKFIIRRKWQKTGNAIRALGRMATLSASRRNSAVSGAGSLPNSPRPSISGIHHMFSPNTTVQMGSLHEEDDDFSIELPNQTTLEQQRRIQKTLKVRDKSQCSERSDSGYSECSNCSVAGNMPCHCAGASAVQVIVQHSALDDLHATNAEAALSLGVPHEVLKTKLEEIAQHENLALPQFDEKCNESISVLEQHIRQVSLQSSDGVTAGKDNGEHSESMRVRHEDGISDQANVTLSLAMPLTSPTQGVPAEPTTVWASPPLREPIMRSDFTNTIKMRKKSLENNALREKAKQQPKPIFEAAGKVSQLKHKFNLASSADDAKCVNAKLLVPRQTSPPHKRDHNKDVFADKRFSCANQKIATSATTKSTNSTLQQQQQQKHQQKQCSSMPNSPLLGRSTAAPRLSGRVREATERLSQQQTVATSARRVEARR
uniref:Myosin light chain kinase, smooth muscle n=4 Tax=Bactrocera latifrons TaxID=174628 RepID=A0A0K8UDN7_BACLA